MKPFLKWAGGKYRLIDKIQTLLPKGNRLIEPFVGSGAVFLNVNYPEYFLSDSNPDLINTFQQLQQGGINLINEIKGLFELKNNQADVFYELRNEFNATIDLKRKAALFIYLNRHGFNGLCRYNSQGGFNVPFGRYTKPYFPEQELHFFLKKSQHTIFETADFIETMNKAKLGDVVYCDPPYVPLTNTANFTNYTGDGFDLKKQEQLAKLAINLMEKGIPVIISNHDTVFTRDIYQAAKIKSFDVQRFISSNGANRNKSPELLAVFSQQHQESKDNLELFI